MERALRCTARVVRRQARFRSRNAGDGGSSGRQALFDDAVLRAAEDNDGDHHDDGDVFAEDDDTIHKLDPSSPGPAWMQRYEKPRRQHYHPQQLQQQARQQVSVATKEPPPEDLLTVPARAQMFAEAHNLSQHATQLWGQDQADLIAKHGKGAALRIKAEERELARQVKAHDTIAKQRAEWGLHPIHFVRRWDTRLDRWGEDRVPYSQERLENEKGRWAIEDHAQRVELEKAYGELGWQPKQVRRLISDWYKQLPEPRRFFQTAYYKTMRPYSASKKQRKRLAQMRKEQGLVVFEERNSHRVIRQAMASGDMPFVRLPSPRLIWEPVRNDCIIDDNICGREDFTLERRQGAVLLRRWLPNGQKISCEVIGGDYLNDIDHPNPLHVDWDQVEEAGGFLIHSTMCNSVDHHNNFRIVSRVEEAVTILSEFEVDPSVEFTPNDYMFFPYLWVTDPSKYTSWDPEAVTEDQLDAIENPRSSTFHTPTMGRSLSVKHYQESRKQWR